MQINSPIFHPRGSFPLPESPERVGSVSAEIPFCETPLLRLHRLLFKAGELGFDGSINPHGFFSGLRAVSISTKAASDLLGNTLTLFRSRSVEALDLAKPVSNKKNCCRFTLKEFIRYYLHLFPGHDVHWIGSSLPLGKLWSTQFLKDLELHPEMKSLLLDSIGHMSEDFADIDIRFMVPPGSSDRDYVRIALESLCRLKTGDPSFVIEASSFQPHEKTKILTFKDGLESSCDIDLIQCADSTPPFLTTLDTAYLSLSDFLSTGMTLPSFIGGVRPGDYFLHKCAKIFHIPDPSTINPGTFKRIIQWQTYGYGIPQKGIIDQALKTFQAVKGGRKQFLAVFRERREHLDPCPKTVLAYCLNLISCVEENYDEEYRIDYWKQCADLIKLPEQGLTKQIALFIKRNYHGCGYLVAVLKACCLMTYVTKKLKSPSSPTLIDIYPGTQNGEPYFVLPIAKSTVFLKLEPNKTINDLLYFFDCTSETPSSPLRNELVNILLEFMKRLMKATLDQNDSVMDEFNGLGIDPARIQDILTGTKITHDPAIHALNIFWKAIYHTSHPLDFEDEADCLRSLGPALLLFKNIKLQNQFIQFIESYTRSDLIRKILTRLKEASRLDLPTIYNVIFDVTGHGDVTACEIGYQIWIEAILHPQYPAGAKSDGLVKLMIPSYADRKTVFDKRLQSILEERKVNPLILTHFLSQAGQSNLAIMAFTHCSAADVKKYPQCLVTISANKKIPLPMRQKLIHFLIEEGYFDKALVHIKKIHTPLLSTNEKKAMVGAATKAVNHLINTKQIDRALKAYHSFVSKGILNCDASKQWNFLTRITTKIQDPHQLSDELIYKLIDLLKTPIALDTKKVKQIRSTLSHVLSLLDFEKKLMVLCVLYQLTLDTQNKILTNFHTQQFNKLMKSRDHAEKLVVAESYAENRIWLFAAQAIAKISPDSSEKSYELALKTLDHLSHVAEFNLMWNILLLYQDRMDIETLEKYLRILCPESSTITDKSGLMSKLLLKVSQLSIELSLRLIDYILKHHIQLSDVPLLFEIVEQHTDDPLIAWNRYLAICDGQEIEKLRHDQLRCLKSIKDACLDRGDSIELTPKIIDHWSQIGVDFEDMGFWMYLITVEMNSYFSENQFDKMINRFRSLERLCTKRSNFVTFVRRCFQEIYELHQKDKRVPTDIFYLLWDEFSDVEDFWDLMRSIALEDGELETVWNLTSKNDRLRFFYRNPKSLEELNSEILYSKKWRKILKGSMSGEKSTFHSDALPGFFKLINKSILDVRKPIFRRELIEKVTTWGAPPKEFWLNFQDADGEVREARDKLTEVKLDLLDRMVMGIWCLTYKNPLNLSQKTQEQLGIMGSVLWILCQRLSCKDPNYMRLRIDFDSIASKFSKQIVQALGDHPKLEKYQKSLDETRGIFNLVNFLFWMSLHQNSLWVLSIIINCCLFYFLYGKDMLSPSKK